MAPSNILPGTRSRSRRERWADRRRTADRDRNRPVHNAGTARPAAVGSDRRSRRPAPKAVRSDCKRTAAVTAAGAGGVGGDRAPTVVRIDCTWTAVAVAGSDCGRRKRAPAIRNDSGNRGPVRNGSCKRVARNADCCDCRRAIMAVSRTRRRGSWAHNRRRFHGDRPSRCLGDASPSSGDSSDRFSSPPPGNRFSSLPCTRPIGSNRPAQPGCSSLGPCRRPVPRTVSLCHPCAGRVRRTRIDKPDTTDVDNTIQYNKLQYTIRYYYFYYCDL